MHKIAVVGQRHLFLCYLPATATGQHLAVLTIRRPVLAVNKMGAFEGFPLVVDSAGALCELGRQLIAFRVCDHEFHIRPVHPFGEGVGYSLRKRLDVRKPCQNNFRPLHRLVFGDGNTVCKRLQRMSRCRFEVDYRHSGIPFKLVENLLGIVGVPVFKTCERAYTNNIAELADYSGSFLHMLSFVPVHKDPVFHFQSPAV